MKVKLSDIFLIIGLFIYKSLLDFVYLKYISDIWEYVWGYVGFLDNHSIGNYILSVLIFFVSLFFVLPIIRDKSECCSTIIVTGLYLIAFLPFTTCIFAGLFSQVEYIILYCIYWIMLLGCELYSLHKNEFSYIGLRLAKENSRRAIIAISFFLAAVVVYISWRYTGFRLNFDLSKVYEYRAESRTWDGGFILGYALAWAGTCIPFLMGYYFEKKKYVWMVILFALALLNFGIEGHKKVLFLPIFILMIMAFCKSINIYLFKKIMLLGVVLLNIFGIYEVEFLGTYNVISMFVRRVMFVPAQLSWYYYDFFQNNPFDYFQSSILRHFGFISPYSDLGLPFRIGAEYFGQAEMRCNNGLMADALTNLGYLGIFVMPVILVALFIIMDRITIGINTHIKIFASFAFIHYFVDTFLFTVLSTHGFLIVLLILMILRPQYIDNRKELGT